MSRKPISKAKIDAGKLQVKMSPAELDALGNRVWDSYQRATVDHLARVARFRKYLERWRVMATSPDVAERSRSNFNVPVIKWNALSKWAKNLDSMFGEDAEIVAIPVGPSEYKRDRKIGLYMTWRVYHDMHAKNRLAEFELRGLLNGRSFAYVPWAVRSIKGPKGKDVNVYKGPDFIPLRPDDLVVPAEDAESVHDFSWVLRKYRATPDELLLGEQAGLYRGIKECYKDILLLSYRRQQRDWTGDHLKRTEDAAEGVNRELGQSIGSSLEVHEWYGGWRMLTNPGRDDTADVFDVDRRELLETQIVVRYLPDLRKVISVQKLEDLFPGMTNKRPFVERSARKDGSYWCDGLGADLLDIEEELTANYNAGSDNQALSISPVVFVEPAAGLDTKFLKKLSAGDIIPVANANGIKVFEIPFNGESVIAKEQMTLAYAERITGLTDSAMGRATDRPNAPRTATGQRDLLEEGNVRQTLDTTVMQEDYAAIFGHLWELEQCFGDSQTFFRVTEEDADGLFPIRQGGSYISRDERSGRYDFRLELATSKWSKENEKQMALARYQIDLQNPIIAQNPNALWLTTRDAHEALGDPNFADMVPEPPTLDMPKNPKEEWSLCQRGEAIHVNAMDNDELHMIRHAQDLESAKGFSNPDPDAIQRMTEHYGQHVQQLQQKKMVQAIAEMQMQQAAQQMGVQTAAPNGMQPQGQPGQGQGMPGVMTPPQQGQPVPPSPIPMAGSFAPPIKPVQFAQAPPAPPAAPTDQSKQGNSNQ